MMEKESRMKSKEELISRVLELFKTLGHNRMRYQKEPWQKLIVPLAQLKSLFLINIKGSINVRELALEMGVTPGNVTSIVDRLVGQGLVGRSESPEDRRIVLLRLTDKGRKTITEIHETQQSDMRRFLERMSAEDISALHQGMNSFLAAIKLDWEESEKNKNAGREDLLATPAHIHHNHMMKLS